MARPSTRSLGLHQAQEVLRHDHSEGIWRARLFALRTFGSRSQAFVAFAHRRRHRDGAEFARPGRTSDAIWYQGAAGTLAAAAFRWPRHSLLRIDKPRGR